MSIFAEMNGKVAVITGATSGIGRASALLFASQGIKVVLAGRNEQKGKSLESEIAAMGSKALFVPTDVSNSESVENLIDVAKSSFGEIHYALNNAGIEGALRPLVETDERDFDEVMGINLKGIWLCLKAQLQAMSSKGGAIVNVSTSITRLGLPETGIYTASKAGVESLTRVAAIEHGKEGIRVNAISPGAVDTPMIHRIYPNKQDIAKLHQGNPTGRMAHAEDVANTALFLLSSLAAHINGEIVFVDGGSSIVG